MSETQTGDGLIGRDTGEILSNDNKIKRFYECMLSEDYEGMLSVGLRRMTMIRVGGVPYEQVASDIVKNCTADIMRKYPYELLRLAYELYLGGMVGSYNELMKKADGITPSLPITPEEREHIEGERLIVEALPFTRDVRKVIGIYERAARLLKGKSKVIDAYDSITAGLHGFPAMYLLKPGTADGIKPYISRLSSLFSGFTGETILGFEELYEGSLCYYRGNYEEAKRLTYKALYLLENTHQAILQISAGEMLAFIATSQQDVECFAEAIDYMKAAAERSAAPAVCRGVVDLCRCGLLNAIGAISDTPGWMRSLSFAEGTLVEDHFGMISLLGNTHFAPSSSAAAFWHHTIYLTTSGQFQRALAVSEIMLERLQNVPVLTACFLLTSAFCYLSVGDRKKAVYYAEQGVALAMQDRQYTLVSDFGVYLDGIVEEVLSKTDPEALKIMRHTDSHIKYGQKALRNAYAQSQFPTSLTEREMEIASLAAQSMRNTDIAEKLGISVNTVKAHLKSIYEKLAIDRRGRLREKLK